MLQRQRQQFEVGHGGGEIQFLCLYHTCTRARVTLLSARAYVYTCSSSPPIECMQEHQHTFCRHQWRIQDLEEGGARASASEFSAGSHTSLLCNLLQLARDYETVIYITLLANIKLNP